MISWVMQNGAQHATKHRTTANVNLIVFILALVMRLLLERLRGICWQHCGCGGGEFLGFADTGLVVC